MTDANTLRRLNKLWKDRHTHTADTTSDDLAEIREIIHRDDGDGMTVEGAYIALTRNATQTIAIAGEAISWDTVHPLIDPLAFTDPEEAGSDITLPLTVIAVPYDAYYGVKVELKWASHTSGGTVEIRRTRATVAARLWPTDDDPGIWTATDGQIFTDFAVIPCLVGDTLSVYLDHDDGGSTQDLASAQLMIYKIETTALRQLYKTAVMTSGPLAYWRLDETSGTTFNDIAGHASGPFNMTSSGTPTLDVTGIMTDGSFNAAVDFEANSNQYGLAVEDDTLKFLGTQAFTVEAWAKPESYREGSSDPFRTIVSCFYSHTGGASEDGWRLGWHATDDGGPLAIHAERQTATTDSAVFSAYDYSTAETRYAVVTYDGTTLILYVDGVQVDTDATVVSIPDDRQTQCAIAVVDAVGSWTDFGEGDGTFDELALYDRALTADEILEHYNIGRGAFL